MGKVMKVTANLYSDSAFTNLVGSVPDIYIGIGTGDTTSLRLQNIGSNYSAFTARMYGEDFIFLGGTYVYPASFTILASKEPHLWFPLCVETPSTVWGGSYYLEYVFANGYKYRRVQPIDTSGSVQTAFYDDTGVLIGSIAGDIYTPHTFQDGRTSYTCIVVSAMDADGAIPDTATMASYGLNGFYGSDMWGGVGTITGTDLQTIRTFFNGVPGYVRETDPYGEGGVSGTGGGTGTFSDTGDDIDIPALPTLSATDSGFITIFNPSIAQLQALASYMWSNAFDLDTFKKVFANPMDCILGLSIVPVAVPNGGVSTVSVGNIPTGVSMTKAAAQYVEVDCGTLNVEEYWGAYLDYDPYTKAEIYLPYIGAHPIAVDDIMGKAVHVVYHVDILSGACAAYVKCGGSILYSFIGQCSSSIPITGNDWTNVINGVLSIAGAVGSMVATGGASAPTAIGTIASTAVNSLKPTVEKSGSLSGTGGMLAVQTPYLILTRPRQALPSQQNTFMGYPSFITENLANITGYTEVEHVHLENIPATAEELSEIENLLRSGVIF